MTDSIVYVVIRDGGGMDGMDHTDKGGEITFASSDRKGADDACDHWSKVDAQVHDLNKIAKKAYHKLDGLEQYALRQYGLSALVSVKR